MDHHNIDRLFREKLDGMEKIPSPKAWDEVEKQISKKKKPGIYYWVAASITLLLISWTLWPENQPTQSLAIGAIDHPQLIETHELSTPIAAVLPRNQTKTKVATSIKKMVNTQLVAINKDIEVNTHHHRNTTEMKLIPQKTLATLSETLLPIENDIVVPNSLDEAVESTALNQVKITYIASNSAALTSEPDSTGVFKKFIALADKLNPGDVLADIKTAKDNFLSSGLKSKKERRSMTP